MYYDAVAAAVTTTITAATTTNPTNSSSKSLIQQNQQHHQQRTNSKTMHQNYQAVSPEISKNFNCKHMQQGIKLPQQQEQNMIPSPYCNTALHERKYITENNENANTEGYDNSAPINPEFTNKQYKPATKINNLSESNSVAVAPLPSTMSNEQQQQILTALNINQNLPDNNIDNYPPPAAIATVASKQQGYAATSYSSTAAAVTGGIGASKIPILNPNLRLSKCASWAGCDVATTVGAAIVHEAPTSADSDLKKPQFQSTEGPPGQVATISNYNLGSTQDPTTSTVATAVGNGSGQCANVNVNDSVGGAYICAFQTPDIMDLTPGLLEHSSLSLSSFL